MLFWIIAGALALLSTLALLSPLLRRAPDADDTGATDMDIYRDQLRELERDIERGVISGEEAERARTEIARRLLAADKAGPRETGRAPQAISRGLIYLIAIFVLGLGGVLYLTHGQPGYDDMPRAARIAAAEDARRDRPTQLELEAQVTEFFAAPVQVSAEEVALIDELRQVVPEHPDELQGWQLLAVYEARLNNYAAAAEAQARVIEMLGDEATVEDRFSLIVNLFLAANGQVSPDLQALVNEIAPSRAERVGLYQSLAREARSVGHFIAASRAQERVIATKEAEERTTEDLERLLDYLVAAVNGTVSPEAEVIAARILDEEPDNLTAAFYFGKLFADTGRPDLAFNAWRRVVERGDPDTFYYSYARQVIDDVAWLAGVDYTAPEAPSQPTRGPSAEDMAAAADMTEEDRAAMIEGMVAQLSDRLATQGGPAPDWAQLINALGVLGRTDQARAVYQEAIGVFAADPQALEILLAAGQAAGVAE